MMQPVQSNLFTRDDTFFGVCQGIGEDLGIHPNFLRVALGGLMFFSPVAAIGGYAAAGVIVLASRLLFPIPRTASQATAVPEVEAVQPEPVVEAAVEPEPVPLAA